MVDFRSAIQTGYSAARCALEWGQHYLPPTGAKVSVIARQALFVCDVIDTAFTGWDVKEKMSESDRSRNKEQFYANCALKAVALVALAALFVKGTNRYLRPQLDPLTLLQKISIPKDVIDNARQTVTAAWTKTTLENLTTALFFIRTAFNLYLAPSDRRHVVTGLLNGATAFKAAQYRTLEMKRIWEKLLPNTNYYYYSSQTFPELRKYFALPVKKVEVAFRLSAEGQTESSLISSIQSVYDYSTNMFENSVWDRHWISTAVYREYEMGLLEPFDEAVTAIDDLTNLKLVYQIKLVGDRPPAPVTVRVLHEDKVWQSFKGIDIFRWIPRFYIPGQKVEYSNWIKAKLEHPMDRVESLLHKAKQNLLKYLKID